MKGRSRIWLEGKLISISDLSPLEHRTFEISAKKAIAKVLGKKVIRIIEVNNKE